MFLEDMLGLNAGSMDIPDGPGWELKWFSNQTRLITLFHKEAKGPEYVMRNMVKHYGWLDGKGRLSFRHTIEGESDRFRVVADEKLRRLVVRPRKGRGPAPYWSYDDLIAAAGAKLRRLLLVKGEVERRKGGFFTPRPTRPSIWPTSYKKYYEVQLRSISIAAKASLAV